jgi:2-amino-4-hydroxy-6-hydroxymethyldihydropteridine diphosphokinase
MNRSVSTDAALHPTDAALHPLIASAADGELPPWARASERRRAHMRRVAELLDGWARALGLPERDRVRWRSLGYLHDSLKDAPAGELRQGLAPPLSTLPGPVLHGPAAAARLADEGVDDPELLDAVRYHTLGHPDLGPAGQALYAADFLEPGRDVENEWRRQLRSRMPHELDQVVREVLQGRILKLVGAARAVPRETFAFWNRLTGGEP